MVMRPRGAMYSNGKMRLRWNSSRLMKRTPKSTQQMISPSVMTCKSVNDTKDTVIPKRTKKNVRMTKAVSSVSKW